MNICRVSPYIRNGCLNCYVISHIIYLLPRAVTGPIKVSVILLQYTCNLSISIRQSKKGVSAFTTQKLTRLIRVLTLTDLINIVELMLNQIFMALVCVVLISILLFMALYARYCLQPAVDFLKALMLIIILQNSLGVQCSIVVYTNRSYLQSIISITGLTGILAGQFQSAIKCIKKQSANIVIVLKAQLSIKGLKVIRNVFKVSYSLVSKLKLIMRASIDLLRGFFSFFFLYFRINWLTQLLNLFLDLLYSSWVCFIH